MSYTAKQFGGRHAFSPRGEASREELYELISFLENELTAIARAFQESTELELRTVKKQPKRPQDGMIVSADGTSWNPGFGKGIYAYLSGSWVLLGGTGLTANSPNSPFYVVDMNAQKLLTELVVESKVQSLILQTQLNFTMDLDRARSVFSEKQ